MTRAFTGRLARGIRNRFLDQHSAAAYPELHHLTAPPRQAGRTAGDPALVNLWAGQTFEPVGTCRPLTWSTSWPTRPEPPSSRQASGWGLPLAPGPRNGTPSTLPQPTTTAWPKR